DDRIAVLGYGEGGAIALRAARREGRIKGVGLLAVPGTTGEDVTLEQQRQMLDRTGVNAEGQQLRIALQQQIIDAVKSGKGWENIPPSVRKQADTPWFRSWLQFDPEKAIDDVNKPILILQGALDAETPPSHADLLEGYARARKRPDSFTRKVIVPGVNHLLVPASSGEVDEYALLPDLNVSTAVTSAIVDWLGATMPAR
ncbi:MAG: alpha/beta hydrolase, partial [Vicinamibacterales bacterium]